jgi:hypothetical protein
MPYRETTLVTRPPQGAIRVPRSRNNMLAPIGAMAVVPLLLLFLGLPVLVQAGAVLLLLGLLGWTLYYIRRVRQGLRALLESQALLNAGSYQAGGEVCEQILERYSGLGNIEATALCNLSVSIYYAGDAVRAARMLDAVELSGWSRPGSALRVPLLQNRTLYLTVLGQLTEAEHASHEAKSLMTAARASAVMLVPDVALAARSGRFADVVAMSGTTESMRKLTNKLLRVLRAWALTETAPDSTEIRTLLDGTKPVAPGELRYITNYWPELQAFLVLNGLSEAT